MTVARPSFERMLQALRRAKTRAHETFRTTGCAEAQSDAVAHEATEQLVVGVLRCADDVMPILDRDAARRSRAGGAA